MEGRLAVRVVFKPASSVYGSHEVLEMVCRCPWSPMVRFPLSELKTSEVGAASRSIILPPYTIHTCMYTNAKRHTHTHTHTHYSHPKQVLIHVVNQEKASNYFWHYERKSLLSGKKCPGSNFTERMNYREPGLYAHALCSCFSLSHPFSTHHTSHMVHACMLGSSPDQEVVFIPQPDCTVVAAGGKQAQPLADGQTRNGITVTLGGITGVARCTRHIQSDVYTHTHASPTRGTYMYIQIVQ